MNRREQEDNKEGGGACSFFNTLPGEWAGRGGCYWTDSIRVGKFGGLWSFVGVV